MLDDIIKDRLKKERSYPARVKRTHTVFEVLKSFSSFSKSKKKVFIVGTKGKVYPEREFV